MKKTDIKKNSFLVRIQDDDILTYINKLIKTGLFTSQNELLNRCLVAGVPEIYKETFKKYPNGITENESIEEHNTKKNLKEIKLTTDEIFVMMNVIESLSATLYNVKMKELNGELVTSEEMESGLLSDLPESLAAIKDEMVKRHLKKR